MKKKVVLFVLILAIVIGFCFIKKDSKETIFVDNSKDNNNLLSMLLETEENSGKYEEVTRSEWPTEGYVFNTTLSRCENGGNLSWDNEKKIVIMDSDSSDKCYVYFDRLISIAEYVKYLYTGIQGENNLYLHDDTLENGAGDGSYRYAGASDSTNNFVCFGYDSTDGTCPSDNLYRIIGVFGDNVKLIKYDYATDTLLGKNGDYDNTYSGHGWSGTSAGTSLGSNTKEKIGVYSWNGKAQGTYSNIWGTSLLNKINLNSEYLNNIGTTWSNKIAITTWKVGGNTTSNIHGTTVLNTYKNEIISPATDSTVSAKVGLMYVSDYGYAAEPSIWTINLNAYKSADVVELNWMYMGLIEWTITPDSDTTNWVYSVRYEGEVNLTQSFTLAVRPVFYLESSVNYVSGNGTKDMPYIID